MLQVNRMHWTGMWLTFLVISATKLLGQTWPCDAGLAGPYPCDGIDHLALVPLSTCSATGANDVWGWFDAETGREYALLGLNNGLAFIDVTDPFYPIYLGKLPTASSNSLWRDMKVYGHHVYVVSEAFAHGLQVFDLHVLREVTSTPETFLATATLNAFSDAHNLAVDEEAGRLYVVGGNLSGGGLLIFDLTDPAAPELVGMHEESGYVHDAVAFTYNGPDIEHLGAQIVACAHPTNWTLLDASDPGDVEVLSSGQHPSNGYTHQPLWLPSGKHLLIGDELDEQQYGFNTRTLWWNVADLDSVTFGGAHFGPTTASDHNQYADEVFVFQSNYTAGLRILQYQELEGLTLNEVAHFDVFPESNAVGFTGSWSNYAHLPSGNILVSSMTAGLHIVRPRWVEAAFSSVEVCQTDTAQLTVTIPKNLGIEYTIELVGQPPGVQVEGLPLTTYGVGSWTFPVTGVASALGAVELEVVVTGTEVPWTWREGVSVLVDGGDVWFRDLDGDGYGDPNHPAVLCSGEPGYASNGWDCYDQSAETYPGAPEMCDAHDNDCNGLIDDDLDVSPWYRDLDGDGYGNASIQIENCFCPSGFVGLAGDCDDYNPFVHPFAPGNQTGVDNNCDGELSEQEVNPCPGDFNFDDQVTVSDLLVILFDYACSNNCQADISGDGMVAMDDLLMFLSRFNTACN